MAMEQKPVGICLRVSTADQVKGESLEVHERRARSYAKAIDTSTPAGRLFFGLLASMATWGA